MPTTRRVSSMLIAIGTLIGGAGGVQAHHLGYPHRTRGSHISGVADFDVCVRPSPSKGYYWKSFEKRREVSCPNWRRVMVDAMARAHGGSHR
jgi:hypothetical protein